MTPIPRDSRAIDRQLPAENRRVRAPGCCGRGPQQGRICRAVELAIALKTETAMGNGCYREPGARQLRAIQVSTPSRAPGPIHAVSARVDDDAGPAVIPRQRVAFHSCRLRHCWVASAGAKPLERTFSDSGAGRLHVA
ncbi:protein of unknown function (plasmid) [Paraburkholderia dioscoreae]|uniref:Uncharacterized protein n=1 Tax=Paraburkholderia dioscoreae TaxID=2604047 RepID=A0A5Q4ZKX9_9BURK|nr:protein of unknown function [Paraburkholderia dioscoreae]